jgi:hypothetical protein
MTLSSYHVDLKGTITTRESGNSHPVYHAEVILGNGFARSFTDSDGYYEFKGIPKGNYMGMVRKKGFYRAWLSDGGPFTVDAGGATKNRVLRRSMRLPAVSGICLNTAGTGASKSRVSLLPVAMPAALLQGDASIYTADDGRFMATNIVPGYYDVVVEMDGVEYTNRFSFMEDTLVALSAQGGLSDYDIWNAQYFDWDSVTNQQAAAGADPDQDGMNNFQEYVAGTDPVNSQSLLALDLRKADEAGECVILFQANAQRSYELCHTTNLLSGVWLPMYSNWFEHGDATFELTVTNTSAQSFYRVKVSKP